MKSLLTVCFLLLFAGASLNAQDQKPKSPAMTLDATINEAQVTINYCSPSVRGREVWGGLVPYDEVWRTGANGATKIEFKSDVQINGKELKAGTYGLFTIPNKDSWTFIFNTDSAQWGAYSYTTDKDVLRVTASPSVVDAFQEAMVFEKKGEQVVLKWENLEVGFTVTK